MGDAVTRAQMIVSICVAMFASGGFWAFITFLIQRHDNKDSVESQMLRGLAHDRICYLGSVYIKRGYVTQDEYQNIHDYLYEPYRKLGGNGTAKKVMDEVTSLPMRKEPL